MHKSIGKCQNFKHYFITRVTHTFAGSIRDFPNTRRTRRKIDVPVHVAAVKSNSQSFGPYETDSIPTSTCVEKPRKRRAETTRNGYFVTSTIDLSVRHEPMARTRRDRYCRTFHSGAIENDPGSRFLFIDHADTV